MLVLEVMVMGLVTVSSLGFVQVTVMKKAVSAVSAVSRVGKEAPKDRPQKTRSQKIVDCQEERTERHPFCVAFPHCLEDRSRRVSAGQNTAVMFT